MHRYILNYTGKLYIDQPFGRGDKVDNRKNNLRIVTPQENAYNTSSRKNSSSKYVGVHYDKSSKKWKSSIKKVRVGTFNTEYEAALARDELAKKEYPFCRLNF